MLGWFREAGWLTANRATGYCRILAGLSVAGLVIWLAVCLRLGGVDPKGYPLAPDFAPYWTAANFAIRGAAASAYDPVQHLAEERSLLGNAPIPTATPFLYPPVFLLFLAPFALLPYLLALLAWTTVTLAGYWAALRALCPRVGLGLAISAFPGVFIAVANGQNGLLSAALFAAATLLLDGSPIVAGVCYGCICYKPQLVLIVPVALLTWRVWPALFAAGVTVAALVIASVAAFGIPTWQSFLVASRFAQSLLENGGAEPARMASIFAAARLWHASLATAYGLQLVSALVAVAGLWLVRKAPPFAHGAALAASVALISPYMFDYDLAVLIVPIAWIVRDALKPASVERSVGNDPFLPWEKTILLVAFVLPLVARVSALVLGLPLGPVITTALFWAVLRRARQASPGHLDEARSTPASRMSLPSRNVSSSVATPPRQSSSMRKMLAWPGSALRPMPAKAPTVT